METKEQKYTEIINDLKELFKHLNLLSEDNKALHKVELDIFKHLLSMGLKLLKYYIFIVNEEVKKESTPIDSQGRKMENKSGSERSYISIYGSLKLKRTKYYSPLDKTFYPLDKALSLPDGCYSYLLADWVGYGAVETDFEESVKQLERILNLSLSAMQSSRLTYHLSPEVDHFYQTKDWLAIQEEDGTHLSIGFDGKGVPIKRSELDREVESVSVKLSKGQKKNVKKDATVSLSSSFTPKIRIKDDILTSLFTPHHSTAMTEKPQCKHQWHEQKHLRAFLSNKQHAINYGFDNVLQRDTTGLKPIVILIDGDKALERACKKAVEERQIEHRVAGYVLDFIHLIEYIWKVANPYFGEKHPDREKWVKEQASLLLDSQHKQVLKLWEKMKKEKHLNTSQIEAIQRSVTYLNNHAHMVDYKSYLEKGFPITTGAVESACGHFVKSRMERNGMRWGLKGVQKMLDVRAIKKNDDWDNYMQHFIREEQQELYGMAA